MMTTDIMIAITNRSNRYVGWRYEAPHHIFHLIDEIEIWIGDFDFTAILFLLRVSGPPRRWPPEEFDNIHFLVISYCGCGFIHPIFQSVQFSSRDAFHSSSFGHVIHFLLACFSLVTDRAIVTSTFIPTLFLSF